MAKPKVYFNEYNVLMDNAVYFPIVSGKLQAFAQTIPLIKENYEFMPFMFYRNNPHKILSQYQDPSVAAFSASMWNSNLSLGVAKEIKEKFPKCLIIFGGYDVPNYSENYLKKYDFIDIAVRGEGEKTFTELLKRNLESGDFKDIPGTTYKDESGKIIRNNQEQILSKDLDTFPSPYLEGVFDEIMGSNDINFQAIVETNRGCPFLCSYCSWGQGGLSKKYRFYSSERIEQVADWIGKNEIKYVFCADSNFGMFKEDLDTAQSFVNTKQKHGFPEKFRVCYSKNAEKNVFDIGKLLHKNQMEKSITISLQTTSDDATKNVRRKNIKMDFFNNLQKKYNEEGIPTYTELILGLPGETYESYLGGLEKCLESGIENQLFSYHCQVYPNAEMGNLEYQRKHGIKTVKSPLNEVHAIPRAKDVPEEYEEIVVSTNTMSEEDWKNCSVISWVMQLFHGLKIGFYPIKYVAEKHGVKYSDFFNYISKPSNIKDSPIIRKEISDFWNLAESILQGGARCRVVPEFSPIYWEPEEISFLNISHKKDEFYAEFEELLINYLENKKVDFNKNELKEIIQYQEARVPDYKTNYSGDKKRFAKEALLWGRKSGKILLDGL